MKKLHPLEQQLRENLCEAFRCLQALGFRRGAFRATAHEYELWYRRSTQAVRLTFERQWEFRYLFVLFYLRHEQRGKWLPLLYFDQWLRAKGWSQEEVDSVLRLDAPVQNLSCADQQAFLNKAAKVLCEHVSEVFMSSEDILGSEVLGGC